MGNKQPERILVRRPCVAYLREMIALRQLKRYSALYWTAHPDLGKQKPYVANLMVLDGYEKGNFDMVIIGATYSSVKVFLVEFKYGKNGYTTEQRFIADIFNATPVEVMKIYTLDDFKEFVDRELR